MERFSNHELHTSEELALKTDLELLLQGLVEREEETLKVIVFAMLSAGTPGFLAKTVQDTTIRRAASCVAWVSRPVLTHLVVKWMRKNMAKEMASYLVAQLDGSGVSLDVTTEEDGQLALVPRAGSTTSVSQLLLARAKELEGLQAAQQLELSATRALARRILVGGVIAMSLCVGSLALNAVFIAREFMPPISLPEHLSDS
jgi:hypothetical protein